MIYYKKFIEFLQKHNLYEKESFIFISNNTTNINYNNEEERNFIGCFYRRDKKHKLLKFKVYVPKIIDEKTLLINIHEYVHALILYKNLNKKFEISLEKEALPLMYEKLYILENEEISMKQYLKDMQETINEINNEAYTIGDKISNELISYKKDNMEELNKTAKKLVRNYKNII